MIDVAFRQDLREFAIELRKLAYRMPAGHEDQLIYLSDRMMRHAERARMTKPTDSA